MAPSRSRPRQLLGQLATGAGGRVSLALGGGIWLAFLLLALSPAAGAASHYAAAFVYGPLLCLGLAAAYAALAWQRTSETTERRYWAGLGLGFGAWALVSAGNFLVHYGIFARDPIRLAVELGYALSYVFVVAAVESRPDDLGPAAEAGRNTPPWHAAALVSGLFATLVLLPMLLHPAGFNTYVSSFGLYVAMDLYIAGRALYFAATTPSCQWRWNYASLGLAFALVLATDLATAWLKSTQQPLAAGSLRDVFWLLPFCMMVLAGAAGSFALADRRRAPPPPTLSDAFAASPLTWALFFPVLHFVADRLGWLDPLLATPRDLLVILITLMLLALAFHRQRRFELQLAELIRERREVQAQLRESENDLRLLLHRARATELLRAAQERYDKALVASLALGGAADGRPASRRDLVASLFELARLPLRLERLAGTGGAELVFSNGAAALSPPAAPLPRIAQGPWQLVLGPPPGSTSLAVPERQDR